MNLKNNNAKKDLRLTYFQENMTAYPSTIELMARYLSTQYPNKNFTNEHNDKKGDRSGKKGDDLKSEDKDSNTGGTSGAHVGDTISAEESTTPSGGASTDSHVLEANKMLPRRSRTVKDILRAHPMGDDDFWGRTN